MSTEQIKKEALALPLAERVTLAEALWESIEQRPTAPGPEEERAAVETAKKRDADLSSGAVAGRPHHQVMDDARRGLGCE